MARFKRVQLEHPFPDDNRGLDDKGGSYHPLLSKEALRKAKIAFLILSLFELALIYLMGRSDPMGLRTLYVLPFFLLLLFFAGQSLLASFSMLGWKEKMSQRQHKLGWQRFRRDQAGCAVVSLLLIVADVVMIALGSPVQDEMLLLFPALATGLLGFAAWRYVRKIPCEERAPALTSGKEVGIID